ncbi:hypothetical protein R5R35_014264 [Gryllus longicercus]|uniref:M-phase phosphoprotein 6 n=1 Tax=Gryllus longicercus TaxID=2509291 RepID=A0AAN9W0Y3_9ORTH
MNRHDAEKKKLSKGLLEMKFMKRSKEKAEKELEAEETESLFAIPSKMKQGTKYIIEPSYIPCEDLIVGRLSFNGMNPEIELIMQKEAGIVQEEPEIKEEEADVTEEEMARHYSSLVNTTAKKFKTKRQVEADSQSVPNKKKYTFLKPQD